MRFKISASLKLKLLFFCIISFIVISKINAQSCNRKNDSLELVKLYNATNGPNWINKWNLSKPMNTWYGVYLYAGGCVEQIVLDNNLLKGTIPNFNLPNLRVLVLNTNQLKGTIPNFNLPNLQILFLSINQFEGKIPVFNNLTKLIQLSLHSNQLSDTIPNFNLTKLQYLYLNNNQLNGIIPNFNLPNLIGLSLHNNQLSGTIPNFNLPNLVFLRLNNNKLNEEIKNFNNCPNLRSLYLHNNNLSGCFDPALNKLCALGYSTNILNDGYNFTNNKLLPWQGDFQRFCNGENQIGASCDDGDANTSNDVIQADCSCKGTPKVVVSTCRQTDSLQLIRIYTATNGISWKNPWQLDKPISTWYGVALSAEGCVTHIDLDGKVDWTTSDISAGGNGIRGTLPDVVLPNLDNLIIDNNNFSGVLPALSGCTNLITYSVGHNGFSGILPKLNLPNLEYFAFCCNQLSGTLPIEIANNCPKLIGIYGQTNQLSGTIPNEYGLLANLKEFYFYENNLEGCIPEGLKKTCPNEGLKLSKNKKLAWQGEVTEFCTGKPQIGATCDDDDVTTTNDILQSDCTCKGQTGNSNACATFSVNAGQDKTICAGEEIELKSTGSGTSFQWTGGATTANWKVKPSQTTAFIVSSSNGNCAAKDTIVVKVNPLPTINLTKDTAICRGQNLTLTAKTTATNPKFVWSNNKTTATINFVVNAATNLTLNLTDANNCKNASSIAIRLKDAKDCADTESFAEIDKECLENTAKGFPNAFSPYNGDGVNDDFDPIKILKTANCKGISEKNVEFVIYENGQLVYNPKKYEAWNGFYKNIPSATKLTNRVFTYVLRFAKNNDFKIIGQIAVLGSGE